MSVPQQPQTPPMDDTQPPMDNNLDNSFGGVSDYLDLDMETPTDNMNQQEYGADFDAGVEANENDNPKKFIQQLTGKLSQSLRKYNQSLPQPDSELSKYVAGMIVKQATEGLSQEDVSDIISKFENDTEETQQPDTEQNMQQTQNSEIMDIDTAPMNETTASTVNPSSKNDVKKAPSKIKKSGYSRKPFQTTI